MTLSIQLSAWALPPAMAVLLALRDRDFLWGRRREVGIRALLVLMVSTVAWGTLNLAVVVFPALQAQLWATRLAYLPASAAAVAWVWFALEHTGRRRAVVRWPFLLLAASATATAALALDDQAARWLVRDWESVRVGELRMLGVHHGPGHWGALAVRTAAVAAGTWILLRHPVAAPRPWLRVLATTFAALAAAAPPFVTLATAPGAQWMDLSSAGFSLGATVLGLGIVHPRLRHLGPVDRDLVLSRLGDPLVVLDGQGRIVDLNDAARAALDLKPYGDVPLELGTLWATGPPPAGEPPPRLTLPPDVLRRRTYEVTVTRLGEGGTPGRTAMLLRDVTIQEGIRKDLHSANAQLERLAREDSLTGLANRRHFMEALEREHERSERYRHPLSVVILDLDHFKEVNDSYGHGVGDRVLREAAQALWSLCRDVDLAARIGGEELALLLPETDAGGALIVAERARERIAGAPHRSCEGEPFRVTASFGVAAAWPGATSEDLLRAADNALYRAKAAGRNQVMLAP